jgi:oxygen-independent coproporphyrinogen-3 oxidase
MGTAMTVRGTIPLVDASVAIPEILPLARRRPCALYVHVPFCVHRCPYCDFAVAEKGGGLEKLYLDALAIEARARAPRGFRPRTIFIGGGTPTELSATGLERLFSTIASCADLSRVREFSIEANPGTLAPRKIATLVRAGVTRVSLGAQSFDRRHLATLGRNHAPEDVAKAVRELRAAGIRDVSLDLIFGIPGQSEADLGRDLERALALGPDHVSTYGLTFEPGTAFFAQRAQGELRSATERLEARLYALARRTLKAAGFRHYELSNFAKPGHACAHNRVYWRNGAYLGLGNSAASHSRGVRATNVRDARAYAEGVLARGGRAAVDQRERLLPERKVRETAYLALRTARGIRRDVFLRDVGLDPFVLFRAELEKLAGLGLLDRTEGSARLSGRGVALADRIAREFL